jgi:hypothetical protein
VQKRLTVRWAFFIGRYKPAANSEVLAGTGESQIIPNTVTQQAARRSRAWHFSQNKSAPRFIRIEFFENRD